MAEFKSIGRLISILHRLTHIYFHRELSEVHLGHGQLPILLYLHKHPGSTQHEIGAAFHMDKGSVSSLIRLLENNNYVYRQRNPNDKREWELFLTEYARAIVPHVQEKLKNWTQFLLQGFSDEERKTAFDVLERLVDNAMRIKQEGR